MLLSEIDRVYMGDKLNLFQIAKFIDLHYNLLYFNFIKENK